MKNKATMSFLVLIGLLSIAATAEAGFKRKCKTKENRTVASVPEVSAPVPSTPVSAPTWSPCALESSPAQKCSFSGRREVRYGTPSNYITKIAENEVLCEDASFSAPTTNYQNTCWVSSQTTAAAVSIMDPPFAVPVLAPPVSAPTVSVVQNTGYGPRLANLTSSGQIVASSGQVISGLRISNPNGPCIVINQQTNVRIVDSEIGPCGGGSSDYGNANIQISGGSNILIEFSNIHDGNRPLIAVGTTNITFRNNMAVGPFSGGQYTGGIEFNQVTGGHIDNNLISGDYPSDVISMFQSSNMTVTHNDINVSIREPSGAGFTSGDSTDGVSPGGNNYIAYNTIKQSGGVPAGVFGSSGNTVIEKNCFKAGIQAYNYSGTFVGVTVRENVINLGASFVPDSSVIGGWNTNINSTDCSLVPQ